MNCLAALLFSI